MKAILVLIALLLSFIASSHQQSTISLSRSQWFVSNANKSILVPAIVPGGIYSDLRRTNVLRQDILYGKNDVAYRWVGTENWTYSTIFAIDHQIARSQSVKLVIHGIDTIARIFVNGQDVGSTQSMFTRYKFDIKPYLKLAGLPNSLEIVFESSVKYASRKSRESLKEHRGKITPPYCPPPAQRGECHVNFIRKMQASFGWDWGPAFPSMGIYKDIAIEYGSFCTIRDILVETRRLPGVASSVRATTQPPPPMIISSNVRLNVRTPAMNNNSAVSYSRAPPFISFTSEEERVVNQAIFDGLNDNNDANMQLVDDNWLLKVTLVAEMVQPSFGYNLRVDINLNNILHYESEHINVVSNSDGFIRLGFNLRIDPTRLKVKPWWPNNAGGQHLYKLRARIMPIPGPTADQSQPNREPIRRHIREAHHGHIEEFRSRPPQSQAASFMTVLMTNSDLTTFQQQYISEKEISFGFRTVELIQEPVNRGNLEDGLTFHFRINGVDLFALGSNWIPSHVLPEYHRDLEYVRYLLQSAKDANMNMLRVWGGGIYESDEFYSMADEMGIMIWHDFMFACALYPADDDYLFLVRQEVEQQVQRLQYHPSIVLWAGNNENEMAIAGPWWPEVLIWSKKLRENYAKLYVETMKPIVAILDPTRPYVESSPSNGIMSQTKPESISRVPNDNRFGDVHHYDYLADSFEWTSYPSTRFASEYGFQSYPSFGALASVLPPSDWKYPLTSNVVHRQHRTTGEVEMRFQIKSHFKDIDAGGQDKFKEFIYVSQLAQAIAIKTETEFYRRNRFIDFETKLGKTMGALYWQLNDVWQAPSWSSIEYGGKWKLLHYFARRFFFPIQVVPYIINPSMNGSSSLLQQIASTNPNLIPLIMTRNQQPTGPVLAVDLVRDDLYNLIDSFNVTIKFYRYTSFVPVWQETIYVRNSRPQNVTRIYEKELSQITRQPGVMTMSGGIFQVAIEQQPRYGLSQIDNYLMPVKPSKVTAMRLAKISLEQIQGPYGLKNIAPWQWACAYRLTLVSDSIAIFVWLDLDLTNVPNVSNIETSEQTSSFQTQSGNGPMRPAPVAGHGPRGAGGGGGGGAAVIGAGIGLAGVPENLRIHFNNSSMDGSLENQDMIISRRIGRSLPEMSATSTTWKPNGDEAASAPFKPIAGTGSDMLRFQFSDNAFNMLEPTKVVDLYLSRCLSSSQVEVALDMLSLADVL